ncbi:MAG: SRPBCC family protein [Pyrinomonadaceae bacterium]|nr:SRPBCC family protein [Pyrinomonadaceae bacterium]
MAEHILETKQVINRSREETFEFFGDAENLERITPPELNFKILTPRPIILEKGSLIDYKLKLRGFPISWRTEITEWRPPYSFIDSALRGPYNQWIHRHTFEELEDGTTEITDVVKYRLPFEPLGDLMHWYVRKELDYIFGYRYKAVDEILNT